MNQHNKQNPVNKTDSVGVLQCIVCNKALKEALTGRVDQPSGGLAFQSHGHYGSTAFDPMDGHYLELNICDDCLRRLSKQKLISVAAAPCYQPAPRELWTP